MIKMKKINALSLTVAVTANALATKARIGVASWYKNEKSNETAEKGSWTFWLLIIGLLVAIIFKDAAIEGFTSVAETFTNVTTGTDKTGGGFGGQTSN